MKLRRVVEPSFIRRPRTVWYVTTDDGERWQFFTKKSATKFMANRGCVHPPESHLRHGCIACGGYRP